MVAVALTDEPAIARLSCRLRGARFAACGFAPRVPSQDTERSLMSSRHSGLAVLLAGLLVQPLVGPTSLRAADTAAAKGKFVQRSYVVADLVTPLHTAA